MSHFGGRIDTRLLDYMLILLLKVRSLHYLFTILLVVSKKLRLVTFAIFADQCKSVGHHPIRT